MAPEVSGIRESAQAARDELWSWALTTAPSSDRMRGHAESADALLEQADASAVAGDLEDARRTYVRVAELTDDALAENQLYALEGQAAFRLPKLRFG